MISFRTQASSIASVLTILGVVMLLGTAVWFSLVPLPTVQSAALASKQDLISVNQTLDKAQEVNLENETAIAPLLWTGSVEQVGPQALSKVNELVRKRGLKLVAFRPQKPVDAQGLTQIPFGITLDGSFLNTIQFVKDLEQPDLKLAIGTVQVASADAATDHVTGTINVVAYVRTTEAVKSVLATTKGSGSAKKPTISRAKMPATATGVKNAKKSQ